MPTLENLSAKLARGERLTPEDALFLYTDAPLDWLKEKATAARIARHGN